MYLLPILYSFLPLKFYFININENLDGSYNLKVYAFSWL